MEKRQISLRTWIEKEGAMTVAAALRVTEGCVRHWLRGWTVPDSLRMQKIRQLSKGAVSMDMTLDEHYSAKNAGKRYQAQERITKAYGQKKVAKA